MLIDLINNPSVAQEVVGGKAYNLARLSSMGMTVPYAIVIPYTTDLGDAITRSHILGHALFRHDGLFAVRSSGVGEDSEGNSYAGMFDTYLDVPIDQVLDRILDVRSSVASDRSREYSGQRGSAVKNMGVIVQHMIPADFAGVAFSVSPIEKDKRIALIEMVPGVGEALVSGKTTPTTIRYNKLTKLFRVQQTGSDDIDPIDIKRILDKLVPDVLSIENNYGHPVDIEWAYRGEEVYILQARPITT